MLVKYHFNYNKYLSAIRSIITFFRSDDNNSNIQRQKQMSTVNSIKAGKKFAGFNNSRRINRYQTDNYSSLPRDNTSMVTNSDKTIFPCLQQTKYTANKRYLDKQTLELGSIQRYQNFLTKKEEEQQRRRYQERKGKRRSHVQGARVVTEINNLADQIREIRRQLTLQQKTKTNVQARLLTEIVDHMRERNSIVQPVQTMPLTSVVPIYVPYPMPYPPQDYYRQQKDNRGGSNQYSKRTSFKKPFVRGRSKFRKLWKKAINCVLFIVYLKRFCKLVREARKNSFKKYYRQIGNKLGSLRQMITQGVDKFVSALPSYSGTSLEIKNSDNSEQASEKVSLVRKLVNLILSGVKQKLKQNLINPNHMQSIYYLCKHGNYSCTEPLLTKQQLQLCCISQAFGYMSCDHNLQKSALMTLLLVKILIFNTLFSRQMKNEMENQQSYQNLEIVGSVLYEVVIDVINDVLEHVPPFYSFGNYKEVDVPVRGLEPMVLGSQHQKGKLISGLRDATWLKKVYKLTGWRKEKKVIAELIETQRELMKKYHQKLTMKFK